MTAGGDAGLVIDSPAATRRIYELNGAAFESLRAYLENFWSISLGEFKKRAEIRRVARAKARRRRR